MKKREQKIYCVNGLAGCVQQSRSRQTGTLVGIYHNEQAGLDAEGGPWSTVCEEHGACVAYSSLASAKDFASDPREWCEECDLHMEER